MIEMLLVAVGAAVGAPLRYVWALLLDNRWPWGTLLVNLTGSGLLGAFAGASLAGHPSAFLATGFCGGFTTYSGFAVQAHDLGPRRGTPYVVTTLAGSLLACWLGLWLTTQP